MFGKEGQKLFGFLVPVICGIGIVYICFRMMPSDAPAHDAHPSAAAREELSDTRHEEALLSEAIKKKPDHAPVLMRLAQMSSAAGKHSDAIRYLREILHREPANTDARLELGKALFESGDAQGAITETKDILDRKPEHADALYNLGAIYANLGDSGSALEYWNRLIAGQPQSASAQRARSMISQLPRTVADLGSNAINRR
jgi:tetratricopeptide (TPR) repeat protein